MNELPEPIEDSSLPGALAAPIPVAALDTPALLVDLDRLERNLTGAERLARTAGVRLRPHAKTHKCIALARLQVDRGAVGVCTAKLSEAAVLAGGGLRDLCVIYPLVAEKAEGLAALAAAHPGARFETVADSERGVDDLSRAATRERIPLGVWIKVDAGLGRAGIDPASPLLEALAARIVASRGLRLAGVVTHVGQVYRAKPGEAPAIGAHEGETVVQAAERLARAGHGGVGAAVGSTPTLVAAARVPGVTEIHPGVYVFGDRQQSALGGMGREDVALTVIATVASHPAPGRWIVDAGSKTLSSDRGAHGSDILQGHGAVSSWRERTPAPEGRLPFTETIDPDPEPASTVRLTRLSEEHGIIESASDPGWGPGDRVEIVPNHACATVNLAERLHLTRGTGADRRVVAVWTVDARACVR